MERTAWLIELESSNSLCLGVSDCGGRRILQWTTPLLATRFNRQEDAESMADILVPNSSTFVSEHQWS